MKISFFTRAKAEQNVNKEKRYEQIRQILSDNSSPMTAREISEEMKKRHFTPTSERNFSAPRLTEMAREDEVVEVGKKKCSYTGKLVTLYALAK